MSVPVTIDLPSGYRRVAWPGRLGSVAAVVGAPQDPRGAVLLVPGFTGSKEDYFSLLPALYDLGWSVAAVDLPGMADSEGPDDTGRYGLAELAGDVVGMLPQVSDGSAVHLVGHSVGGLIAREAALRSPAGIATLTLYDSGRAHVGESAQRDIALLAMALQTNTPGQVHRIKETLDAAAGKPPPAPRIQEFLSRRWELTSSGHLLGMGGIALSAPDRADALADLARFCGLRVMVLHGANDTDTWPVADFAELARQLQAHLVVIEGAAHSPAVENPDAMVVALDEFWRGQP